MSFKFTVHSNRWNRTDTYTMEKTATGWHISHIAINGDSKPNGEPILYANFDQDYIAYPSKTGDFLEWIWQELDNNNMNDQEAQTKIDELADWVSVTEKNTPMWQGWNC
ncbi:TPA: hypothetical protein ACSUND_004948 [Salmonella enterica subsp. diarizonae]|nr:hypothetical protein [Salmonella enterica subsp. enterica serovar Montevideo]HEA0269816.1 hypothetical protein [Salmonella enterica]